MAGLGRQEAAASLLEGCSGAIAQGLISEKHLRSQCTLIAPETSHSIFCCAQPGLRQHRGQFAQTLVKTTHR